MSELIAEARVLVTPDTTAFRALLTTELAAATKGVTVPVQVTPVVTGATAASAQSAQIAGAQAAATQGKIASSAAAASTAQAQMARSADVLAVAERRAAISTSEASAAQIRYTASIRSTEAASRAFQAALLTQDAALITTAAETLGAARANEALALSSVQAARSTAAAQSALASSTAATSRSLSGLTTGAASAGLSLAGLRGATLAANAPFLAGAAGAIAFGKAIQIATSFNSEIAVLGATTGATGEQLSQAAEAAREFGRDITLPGVTAGDAAKTITEFSKAGLELNDAIDATRGGLQLAQAAQLSYSEAVELSANALNAFNLSGSQAVRVADTLANAANLAQGGIADTALALRQAAGAAAVVGVSFEDTTALLTLLARNGLTGSDAGTALRTAFLRLVNPTDKAREILEELNVQLRDINGNVRPEVFADFAAAQRDLSVAQQQTNAAIVFGQDAFRAFGFLGREGRAGLDEVTVGLQQTGTAARIAQARMTGLAGAQENLSNQLTALGETIGQVAIPPLTVFVDLTASLVGQADAAAQNVVALGKAFAGIELPERPPGVDAGLGFLFENLNPITGITSPLGQINRIGKLFRDESDDAAGEIRNGGVELRSGIEDASREAARGAETFGDQITGALDAAFALVREKAAQIRGLQFGAVGRAQNQASGLDEIFDQAIAGGASPQEQIAILKKKAAAQARIITSAGPDAQGDLLKARREAQSKLASINSQITSIEDQIAADADRARDEQRRIREDSQRKADQDFLQRQEDARTAAQRRIVLAEDTPQLQDDIRRQTALRTLIQAQIASLRASAVDERTKQDAIRALRAAQFATTQEIKALRQTQKEQQQEEREAAFERAQENASLRTQIAEARGNDSAVIQFIDQEIRLAQQAVVQAKKAGKGILQATLELEQLREKKRELLKQTDEDSGQGLTIFEVLRQNAETFNQTGGNLITGNQPFAGPTGFTADVAQFLHRPATTVTMVQKPAPSTENLQRQVNEQLARLITAIEANTAAQGGNASTVDQGSILGARANAMARFWLSKRARDMTEAESP